MYTSSYIPSLTILNRKLCWCNPFFSKNTRRIRFTCPLTMYCVQMLTARQLDRNSMARNQFHNSYLFFCWSTKFHNSKPLQNIFFSKKTWHVSNLPLFLAKFVSLYIENHINPAITFHTNPLLLNCYCLYCWWLCWILVW